MDRSRNIVLSFDLDFTLIDNSEGIVNSFKYAFQKYSLPPISNVILKRLIGEPLDSIFARFYDGDPNPLSLAFREYYKAKGMYQVKFIPGIKETLIKLAKYFKLGLITSKKQELATQLLEFLDIAQYFDYIIGETEQIKSKIDENLINFLNTRYKDCKFVIIGDHLSDKKLAKKLNCPFIGVLTGTSTALELNPDNNSKILILNSASDITVEIIQSLFQRN